jgi:predicted peroxiredoxin
MANYLLIESRDPFDSNDVANFYGLASGLAKAGNGVTLFLVQNGVLPARQSSASAALAEMAGAGVEVLADAFSLEERGIGAERLVAGVSPAPLERVIDAMADGHKTIWH